MLIGLVALIVFGPRKLPGFARTIGKTMADFRRSSDEFKRTWQKELDIEEAKKSLQTLTDFRDEDEVKNEKSISRKELVVENIINEAEMPTIKEISEKEFNRNFTGAKIEKAEKTESVENSNSNTGKQDWL